MKWLLIRQKFLLRIGPKVLSADYVEYSINDIQPALPLYFTFIGEFVTWFLFVRFCVYISCNSTTSFFLSLLDSMSSLIELQRNYLLQILREVETAHNIKFLVIDSFVEKLITYLFVSPNELLNHVTSVDKIDSPKRTGQPSVDVIYLLQPTKFNVNCMEADFSNDPPRYRRAHIRFLPGLEEHVLKYFQSRRNINQYITTLKEVKLSLIPKETQFFQTLSIDKPLQIFYNQNCTDLVEKNIKRTVYALLNVCIITGEYPIIRYSEASPDEAKLTPSCSLAKKLANEFQLALDNYVRDNTDFPPQSERPRSVFAIVDRSLDLFSPLLHNFSYQSLAYDVVQDIDKDDVYHYSAETETGEVQEKTSKLLDLVDPDWIELKHQHIVDANEYLSGKMNEMIARNPLLVDRSKVKNTTDLLKVVAHLKDFDEDRRRLILHKTLIESCLTVNHDRRLAEMAEIEQNLAGFGLDIDGERCKNITETVLTALMSKQAHVTDKLRLIIIYALYRGGLIEADFMKLLSFIGITKDHEFFGHFMMLFKNFKNLGFPLIKGSPRTKPFKKRWTHDTIIKDPTIYTTSRFIPSVGNILSKVIANPLLLSEEEFPYVKDKPIELLDDEEREAVGAAATPYSSTSLRNQRHKASWTKNSGSIVRDPNRQRVFYYVLGGITYPEIQAAYEQSNLKNKDVFIGSDGIIRPVAFLRSVEFLTLQRKSLGLQDDIRQREHAPEFLYDPNIAKPVSHTHYRSHNAPVANTTVKVPVAAQPTEQQPVEKTKKRSKFKKFLRSKKE